MSKFVKIIQFFFILFIYIIHLNISLYNAILHFIGENVLFMHKCEIGYSSKENKTKKFQDPNCLNKIFKTYINPNQTQTLTYNFSFKYNPGIKSQLKILENFPITNIYYGVINSNISVYKVSFGSSKFV